ncbi:MAG: Holliday junction resolvase RuvX [Actinobacteria bacterium]|nr:Holliday junction resolvase RuvX [Actinomycetota bacterium]
MGLDIGDKRIGVAVTDKLGIIATPLTVIKNDDMAKEHLLNIIKEKKIKKIIIGLPYNLKGETGFQAKKVVEFVENNLKSTDIQVEMIDERFTSKISYQVRSKASGDSYNKKDGTIDKMSAAILLNDYIEKNKN